MSQELPPEVVEQIVDQLTEEEFIAQDEDSEGELSNEEISKDFTTIVGDIDTQERITRDRMLRLWKYLDLLWTGAGNYYWDHMTGQWRSVTQEDLALLSQEADIDPTLINKVVNMIRPYGESLIGVLTTGTPKVNFFPEDADNDLDIQASKGYSNVEEKVSDDNFMNIRLMEILRHLWNGGFAAAYNYSHADKKYGIFNEEVYEPGSFKQDSLICTECGEESLGEKNVEVNKAIEEQAPDTDVSLDEINEPITEEANAQMEEEQELPQEQEQGMMPELVPNDCPNCGGTTPHISTQLSGEEDVLTGHNEIPKSRQIINIFGPMNVKIPAMAVREEQVLWLILEEEIHVALAKHLYPEHRDEIEPYTSGDLDIDRIARSTYEVSDDTLKNYCTLRKVWLRPASFEMLEDEDRVSFYKERYPKGVKAVFVGDTFLEAEEEDIDDHWTLSINPMYNRIQADPLGKALIGLHETANDLFQLEVDNVRFSIPSNFADPDFFDFEAFQQSRALPGSVTPMVRPPGGSLSDVFHETKTATLPREVENLDLKVEKLLQFISGVLPSVFGGPGSGSKTLGEYQESKNQALQRLSIVWKVVSVMYAKMMAKATKDYIDNLLEDEKFVREQGTGTYTNVWIRRAQFTGKIGEVRPELTEQFPSTWGQISAKIMELFGMNNEVITSWLLHPENVELIYNVLGVKDLHIPGEEQRNKQLFEISQLIMSQPIETGQIDEMTGQPEIVSSVPIEPIDDDQVHMAVAAAFLNSSIGIELKSSNQGAYANVLYHYMEHQTRYQEAMMAQEEEAMGDEEGSEEVSE